MIAGSGTEPTRTDNGSFRPSRSHFPRDGTSRVEGRVPTPTHPNIGSSARWRSVTWRPGTGQDPSHQDAEDSPAFGGLRGLWCEMESSGPERDHWVGRVNRSTRGVGLQESGTKVPSTRLQPFPLTDGPVRYGRFSRKTSSHVLGPGTVGTSGTGWGGPASHGFSTGVDPTGRHPPPGLSARPAPVRTGTPRLGP